MKQKQPIARERRKTGRKLLAAVLSLAMILTLANPTTVFAAEESGTEESGGFWSNAIESIADFFGFGGDDATDAGAQARAATTGDGVQRTADTDTTQEYTLGDEDSTQYDGRVWVDKSVSAEKSISFGGNTVTNDSDFLVAYSALATSTVTVGQTPTDTVFILDFSTSMTWGYRLDHVSVAQDQSRIQAMITSVNNAIGALVKANPKNRIAIAVFNGSSTALLPNLTTGADILQHVRDGNYLSIYGYTYTPDRDGGRADVRCNINGETTSTGGGTNIQAGMFAGMKILADNKDTTAEVNGETVTRIPNVILMSDGAPTTFSSANDAIYRTEDNDQRTGSITNDIYLDPDRTVQSGSWWSANSGKAIGSGDNDNPDSADGFMALLTASYYKNAITDRYYGNSGDEANIYTISFGTDIQTNAMVAMANLVLNPEGNWNSGATQNTDQVQAVVNAWNTYSQNNEPVVQAPIGHGNNDTKVNFRVSHPTGSSAAYDPDSLFYPTQYFAAADDKQLEQIFEEIASMITSSASVPTEVTGNPIDSGYIRYKDTTGQYMEIKNVKTLIFMDQVLDVTKDENNSMKGREVYVAGSYEYSNPAYPGQSFNTDQIEIVVTDNGDNTQTIEVNVPAALIPLRTNTVTLDGNGDPTNNDTSTTLPLRLCYEVGLAEGIAAATLNGVDEDYLKNNSENGKVSFYSNAYTEGGQTNSGVGATVEFEPAPTNPFYFVQEDTPLYVADEGSPTGYSRATGQLDSGATYYVPMTYYDGAGPDVKKVTSYVARSGETLAEYVRSDNSGLYIREGSPRIGNLQDVTASKSANETGTYGNYREPTFVFDQGDTDPQAGHFLVLLGNNGKLSVPFVSKDVSLASDNTHASIDGQLVGVGEKLHYTIDWVNTAVNQNGTAINSEITVVDTLPAGTTYVENSAQPADALYNKDANTITWTIQAAAGQSGTVEFDVVVDSAAVDNENNALPNTATITVGNNSYTTNTTVNYVPEKSVSMSNGSGGTADADGETVMPGTQLTYTIEYRNTESTESTVAITDAVPEGTTFVSATGNPTNQPQVGETGNLEWTISNVAAGATGSVSFTVEVDNSAVTTIENEANVKIGDHNPVVTNKVTTNVDRASLIVKKEVTADPGLTAPDKEFDFELTIPSKAGLQNVAATIHTDGEDGQTTSLDFDADGKTTFKLKANQSLEIPGMGSVQYSVVEQNAANGAVNSGFTLSNVKGATGASSADNGQPINDVATATAAGTVGSDNATVTFTNNYSVKSTTTTDLKIELGGTKNIEGRDFQTGDVFTFTIAAAQATSDAPLPVDADNDGEADTEVTITPDSGDSASFEFGEITFEKPGEYRYIIQEVNYDTDNDDTTQNSGGIDYDAAIYRVNIVIVDNGDGTLRLATTDEIENITTQGDLEYTSNPMVQVNKGSGGSMIGADNNAVAFTNTYNADATTASIQGTKILTVSNSGYTLEDGDFKFTIEALGSAQTDPDKTSYSEGDFTEDGSQPIPVDSEGNPDTEAVNIANGNVSFQFAQGVFTKDMIGKTFGYKITESAGNVMSNGITYDQDPARIVWITVSDDGHGNVVATVMPNDGQQQGNNFTFNNSYEPEKITIGDQDKAGIEVQKIFTGHVWTDEYEFQFKIEPVSTTAAEVAVADMPMPDPDTISIGAPQSGTINTGSFGEMTFSKAGEYVYKITELDDNNVGTTCADADQTVRVNVTEDETTGTLSAEIVYENSQQNAAFTNTYTATFDGDTAVTLMGTKNLDVADGLTYALEDGDFAFAVTPLVGAPAVSATPIENTNSAQVVDTNDWTSEIALLNKLTFDMDELGGAASKTFSYVVTENLPAGMDPANPTADGITYDTAAYKVDITVTDNGKGTLRAADPEITKGVWDGSGFTADSDQTGVSGVVFTNSYEPAEITLSGDSALTVNKNVVGADTDADFSFTATFNAEESAAQNPAGSASGIKEYSDTFELTGAVSDSFTAGETKSVSLSEVTFTRPGTYVFDVNEDQTEAPEGWSYDNTTRQIVVKIVERNGALAVDGEIAAPTFTNIYFNYGDAKDVFATDVDGNKTGSSIDGQLVGFGDTLTYEITWTNTKSEAANVVVTDTIPTGTQIAVDADSNNIISDGGVLDNGVITWNLGQKEAGEFGTVSFAVVVTEDALDITEPENTVTNQATITIGEGASQVELITNRTENPVPEKSVTDNDPSTDGTQVGDTLTYTIQYANAEDEPVDMVITDTLDEGLTYVPDSAGENAVYDTDTRTITWTLNAVPANTMDGQVSFQAVVNENALGQTIENEAQITVGDNPQITTNKTETEVKTGSLTISKTVTVNTDQGTTIDTEKEFTFTVVLTDKKGNQLDGEYSYSGTSDGTTEYQGTITSTGTIKLKHEGSVTITGLPEGAEYTVTETPETGYTAENAELKGAIPADSAATAAFVNNYSAGQVTLNGATNLEVTKEFTGKDWGDEVFTFTLTQTGGDTTKVTLPDNADNLQIGKDTKDHKAAFGDIIFTAAGEYTFEISEVIPENPGQIHYDDHKATITVNVTDNKSGDLVAVASATTSGSMTFKNTYTPQEITANIQALKTMSGRDLRDTDDFTFMITPQNGAPATTRPEAHNGGQNNAVIDFGTATFTEAGTYTYLITETGGNVAGVTNSTQTITATVQVDYNEATGTLSSEVSYSGGDGDAGNMFTNVYQAAPVVPAEFETGITGTKTVTASEGNSYTMQGGEFSFTLTPAASNPSTDPVKETTITNGADGSLVFVSGPVTYTESGTYTYTVKENDSSEGGITEDGSLYTIVVEVTDSGNGQLAADVSISKDGNVTDAITFDNSYDPAKTGVTISGTKELTGKNIENNMFTFRITGDNDAPMPSATEVQNVGSSFAFGTIEYTEPGTYVYHISEVNDGKTGYTYDDTVYDVTVVVTDTDGALHADVSGADAIVFKNSYDPGQVTLTGETALRAHKTLTGRELNAEEFVFEVKDADGNVLTTGTNDADGNVVFGDLTFDQTGTYNYTISERNDSLGGITYDGTIYTVQIDVTDAGGYLEAAVQYFEGNTQTDLPEFENEYTAASTGVSLGASKILTGRDLKDGEFTFVLKDADGNTVDEAVNDANGSVKFDEITYDQAGTYRYTVSEVKGDDTTITYDETVYDVTVEVADNGSGTLVPTVTIGNGDSQGIVFTNEYNEPENPTPGNEDTPDDKTPDKKPDNGGTTQSTDKGNVQTGDTAQFMPVVAALLASLLAVIAIAVVMIRRRRR